MRFVATAAVLQRTACTSKTDHQVSDAAVLVNRAACSYLGRRCFL